MMRPIQSLALLMCGAAAGMGCAHTTTSWTPETVRPPAPEAANIATPAPLTSRATPLSVSIPMEDSVPVTRDGALLTGLVNNREIEVARFGPEIGETFIDESRAVFDPRLLASVSRGRQRRQTLGFSQSSGGASVGSVNATKQGSISSVANVLNQVQQLNRSIDALSESPSTVIGNSASIGMQQYLPTGTLLFLTGEGAQLDHNDIGDDSRHAWTVGLTQPLLRGADIGANLAALRQSRNVAAQSEHEFRMTVIAVVQQIEQTYWELVLAKEVLAIREAGVALAAEQTHREQELMDVGKALGGDVMSASAERAARQADLADAQAALKAQAIELIRLIHPDDTPRWELTFDPQDPAETVAVEPTADESERLSLLYRPELAQARLTLANLELDVEFTRNGRLPQLNLVSEYATRSGGASASGSSSSFTEDDTYSVGLQFETALGNRAERARFRRARLLRDRGASYIRQLEEGIAAEVRQAIIEVDRQWQRLAATQEAVVSREEAVRVIQGRHEVGKATNLDVLQVQRDFIQAQVDDATARVRYIEALTALYAAEGTLLERRGISTDDVSRQHDQQESARDEQE